MICCYLNNNIQRQHQIEILFENNGYFNVTIKDSTIYKRKKARVYYKIKSGDAYKIRNIKYEINNLMLSKY